MKLLKILVIAINILPFYGLASDLPGNHYIRFPYIGNEGHKTLGNWYTSLLNAHGNPIAHYGDLDSTMTMKKLPQEGPVKRFMKA